MEELSGNRKITNQIAQRVFSSDDMHFKVLFWEMNVLMFMHAFIWGLGGGVDRSMH